MAAVDRLLPVITPNPHQFKPEPVIEFRLDQKITRANEAQRRWQQPDQGRSVASHPVINKDDDNQNHIRTLFR